MRVFGEGRDTNCLSRPAFTHRLMSPPEAGKFSGGLATHFLSEGMSFTQRRGGAEDGIVVVLNSFPSCTWERTCTRSCASRASKYNFPSNCVPKHNLGTRATWEREHENLGNESREQYDLGTRTSSFVGGTFPGVSEIASLRSQ